MARRRHTRIKHNIIDDRTDVLGSKFRIYLTFGMVFIAVSLALFCFMILSFSNQPIGNAIAASAVIPFTFFLFAQFFLYFFYRFECRQCHTRNVQVLSFIVGHKAHCLHCSK